MRPIHDLPRKNVRGVFADLDHTLTNQDGTLSASTLESLEQLKQAGLWVVLVSGRPAGWADCMARLMPLDAMIFENGAGVYYRDGNDLKVHFERPQDQRLNDRKTLDAVWAKTKKAFPRARLAGDQPYRLHDVAVDYAEDEPRLPGPEVEDLFKFISAQPGITAKLSSIHINFWVGHYTKRVACEWLLKTVFDVTHETIVYCGDSPNDEPLFEYFPLSVGVRNIDAFASKLCFSPRFVTASAFGAGFSELVNHLLTR